MPFARGFRGLGAISQVVDVGPQGAPAVLRADGVEPLDVLRIVLERLLPRDEQHAQPQVRGDIQRLR